MIRVCVYVRQKVLWFICFIVSSCFICHDLTHERYHRRSWQSVWYNDTYGKMNVWHFCDGKTITSININTQPIDSQRKDGREKKNRSEPANQHIAEYIYLAVMDTFP